MTRGTAARVLVCCTLLFAVVASSACAAEPPREDAQQRAGASEERALQVAPWGSDHAEGTPDDPWRTVGHALPRLRPGDTLYLRGGTYVERIRNPHIAEATSEAPVVVAAYPGERPVIQGLLWLRDASHWTLDGVNVTWDPDTGAPDEHMVKLTDGIGWQLRNAEVWGARSFAGVLVASSGGTEPADWRITDSCIHDTLPANATNQDHLVYVNAGLDAGPGVIERNVLWGAPNGNGVKLGGPSSASGGTARVAVRDNTIHDVVQGVLIAGRSHNNTVEGNLITAIADGYAAIRGFELQGQANIARGNAVGSADALLRNDVGTVGVADGGENRFPVDPRYTTTGTCDGFQPTNGAATNHGHLARAGDDPGCAPARFVDRNTIPTAHRVNVDCAFAWRLVTGFADAAYRPGIAVRRDQLASYLARTLDAGDVHLPEAADHAFSDVAEGSPHADSIGRLAAAGIVLGGPAGQQADAFDPSAPVRRDQVAAFLVRAAEHAGLQQITRAPQAFVDVPPSNLHFSAVNHAARTGLVTGAGESRYLPAATVRRDQMASLVVRLLENLSDRARA